MSTPEYLYKIVSEKEWRKGVLLSSIDSDFIHLATEAQVPRIVEKFWKGKEYVILKLDSKKLIGRLVYETNPGGTTFFYHLYDGEIPSDAIINMSK